MARLPTRVRIPLLALSLSLPLAATADPVSVTTRSSGFVDPNPGAVYHLGIDLYDAQGGPLPYTLTIRSTFDPDDLAFEGEDAVWLQIGDESYRTDGSTRFSTSLGTLGTDGTVEHEAALIPEGIPRYVSFITNRLDLPAGSGDLLAPRTLSLGPGQGSMHISTFLDDPEAPSLSWQMDAGADAMSFQVLSLVPEPAPAYALLAGLGTVCFWGRRRRRLAS